MKFNLTVAFVLGLALQVPAQAGQQSSYSDVVSFGDSLSQYLAQIGRFGTFNTDEKPWPFADWPTPRAPDGETAHSIPPAPHPVRDEEPKL